LPITIAHTRAETPDEMCTTVPPAKSSAPSFLSQPPSPQTQWASGSYTNVAQSSVNTMNAENFLRSAKAPVISAGVMIANIIWKIMNTEWGMVFEYASNGSPPTPRRPIQSSPPMMPPLSGPKASV
jgi:hypothetical protein